MGSAGCEVNDSIASRVAGKRNEPVFKQAGAWGPVEVYLRIMEKRAKKQRGPFAAAARQKLAELRKARPDHPFGAILEEELGRLLEE